MRRWFFLLMTVTLAGCVTPPDVKVASSEVGVALRELGTAQRDFGKAYIAELEAIRRLIESSILSDAVNKKVDEIVNADFKGDLISLSAQIKTARDQAKNRVDIINKATPPGGENPDYEKFVMDTLVEDIAPGLKRRAQAAENDPNAPESVKKDLRDSANKVEKDIRAKLGSQEIQALADMVLLTATQQAVTTGLKDLNDYVNFLRLIHKDVDDWVKTDVTVSGGDLATLVDKIISPGDGA